MVEAIGLFIIGVAGFATGCYVTYTTWALEKWQRGMEVGWERGYQAAVAEGRQLGFGPVVVRDVGLDVAISEVVRYADGE